MSKLKNEIRKQKSKRLYNMLLLIKKTDMVESVTFDKEYFMSEDKDLIIENIESVLLERNYRTGLPEIFI